MTSAPPSQPAALDPGDKASTLGEIDLLIAQARRTGDEYYLHRSLGAGSVAPLPWLAVCRGTPSWYWRGRGEATELAGHGIAFELRIKGESAAESAMAIGQDILRRCHLSVEASSPTLPRLLCGFAFDPQAEPDDLWEDFPDAWLVLPRVYCEHRNGQSQWFVVARVTRESTPEEIDADLRRAREELAGQLGTGWSPRDVPFGGLSDLESAESWNTRVGELTRRMDDGVLQKVVLARRFRLRSPEPPDPWSVVQRLVDASPGTHVFGVQPRPGVAFVGASPERLVRMQGRTIETECVAGTIGRGSDSDSDHSLAQLLLSSRKDNLEHYYVLEDILQALGELCESMEAGASPQILKLPTLQHLITKARGRLREDRTLADVLTRLHPTPAVGGSPRAQALEVIREMESAPRGWYAGPVGWMGPDTAEFAVAIRSAMITPTGATVFAGAGIVPGSEPDKEWRETENKARAFVSALQSLRP